MQDGFRRISAEALKAHLHDGQEIALLDAREEATFDKRHLFMASCADSSGFSGDALILSQSA